MEVIDRHSIPNSLFSIQAQGKSGLGVVATRKAIAGFAVREGFELWAEHVDVETVEGSDVLDRRTVLAADADLFMLHLFAVLAEKNAQ